MTTSSSDASVTRSAQEKEVASALAFHVYANDYEAKTMEDELSDDLEDEQLYEDPGFPADMSSLYTNGYPIAGALPLNLMQWKRMTEQFKVICGNEIANIEQGALDNAWLLNAFSVVAIQPELIRHIFVSEMNRSWGLYTLKFFFDADDQWKYIHLDDRIPCSIFGRRCFASSQHEKELGLILIEKAMAKIRGNYDALHEGPQPSISQCVKMFTGRPCMSFPIDVDMWSYVFEQWSRHKTLVSGINDRTPGRQRRGILPHRVYSIKTMLDIQDQNEQQFQFVQIRNFVGLCAWTGPWSAHSSLWTQYPAIRDQLKPEECHKDEWWMSWPDFCHHMSHLILAPPTTTDSPTRHSGEWMPNHVTLGFGGVPGNPLASYPNPQYSFSISDTPVDVLLELKLTSPLSSVPDLAVGWTLARVPSPAIRRLGSIDHTSHVYTSEYLSTEHHHEYGVSVAGGLRLSPGSYVLSLFTTASPKATLGYVLQFFTTKSPAFDPKTVRLSTSAQDQVFEAPQASSYIIAPQIFPETLARAKEYSLVHLQQCVADLTTTMHTLKRDVTALEAQVEKGLTLKERSEGTTEDPVVDLPLAQT